MSIRLPRGVRMPRLATSRASSVPEPISMKPGEDPADMGRALVVDEQFPVLDAVAVGRHAAHPHALLTAGGDLVADALSCDLSLELGEAEQDVQRQPPHRRGRVERLCDRNEGHVIAVEHFDQFGEVGQRAAEAVDLVDNDNVDEPVLNIRHQLLQARAVQCPAGNAAVVILIADEHPALGPLAGDVCLAGLPLGVQAVEFLLQPFLGGFARVDRAAQFPDNRLGHAPLRWFFSPKNTQPFQRVPVMARAMAESDL